MPILVDDIIQLKGINSNNETVPTLGHFQLQLFVGIDTNIAYRFHVVEEIDLGYDGIIGTDFLNDLDGIIDYKDLIYLDLPDPGSRLVRWRLKLEEFDYKIEYKKSKINSNADALSRFPVNPIQSPNHDHIPSTTGQSQPSSPITLEYLGEIPLIPIDSDSLPSVDLLDNEDPLTDLLNPEDSPQNDDPLNPQTT
ncbi:unnamed protein product [Pieris brassicae]|uniref:Reverse transcriptase domain-containing protein n=1 Tax=Pieris brassicae TaxID=7116 RepID=A0A9P0TUA3_PIEBR|nr:unnamed protein product [Pieris brassicae]